MWPLRFRYARKPFPTVERVTLARCDEADGYDFLLLADAMRHGIIRDSHLLAAIARGRSEPTCVVVAEVNNRSSSGGDSGSHRLMLFSRTGRTQLRCSDEWGDQGLFEEKGRELLERELRSSSTTVRP